MERTSCSSTLFVGSSGSTGSSSRMSPVALPQAESRGCSLVSHLAV